MTATLSTHYALKWQVNGAEHYKFTADGICVNTKRCKVVKRVLNGRCDGWCISGKFVSAKALRPRLMKIDEMFCPF